MIKTLPSFVLIIVILSGCASELFLTPTHLNNEDLVHDERILTFSDDVDIVLSSGYSRKLNKGTKWRFVGTIKEGKVFKPIGTVFTIEGAHVREAYLAINNNQLVGFYIPGENSFSPLGSSMSLPLQMEGK